MSYLDDALRNLRQTDKIPEESENASPPHEFSDLNIRTITNDEHGYLIHTCPRTENSRPDDFVKFGIGGKQLKKQKEGRSLSLRSGGWRGLVVATNYE